MFEASANQQEYEHNITCKTIKLIAGTLSLTLLALKGSSHSKSEYEGSIYLKKYKIIFVFVDICKIYLFFIIFSFLDMYNIYYNIKFKKYKVTTLFAMKYLPVSMSCVIQSLRHALT